MTRHARTILILATSAALAGALPATARAGGYDVTACNATVAGGANNSFVPVADNGMTAYSSCPAGQGLVARNVYDNGQSSWLQGAYMIFDAPPGDSIDWIAFAAGLRRNSCTWSTEMVASNGDLGGNWIWGDPANQSCDGWYFPNDTDFFPDRTAVPVNNTRVRIETRCGAASCPRTEVSTMRIKDVTVHVRDNTAPTLSAGRGALWDDNGWLSGNQAIGFDARDGSGISNVSVGVDGQQAQYRGFACDFTLRAPCPQGGLDATLATSGWPDGDHTLTLTAVDAGGNAASVSHVIHVDSTPPDPPQNLTVEGGDRWRADNDFAMHWTLAPVAVGAHVASALWDLCPEPSGEPCVRGSADRPDISSLSRLQVPAPGVYTLKLWLRDEAGNQDPRLAAPPVTLRYDDASPTLAFESLRTDDPTLVTVDASDKGSGVASGQVSIRPTGGSQWTALPTTLDGSHLTARLDDTSLPDGTYELSATATDQAGNEHTTQQRLDGTPMTVALPLRLKTNLRAGVMLRGGRAGTRLARTATVRYGRFVRVRGRLTSPPGNPMQGVTVRAFTQVQDGSTPRRLIATLTTSRTGRFTFLVRRGPSRTISIEYDGGPQIRGSARQLELSVRSDTTIRPSRHHVSNGEVVTFHGRIRTGRIPAAGKLVELQVNVRGRWRTFMTARAGRDGRWQRDYRFDGTHGSVSYRFRARVPRENQYPFAPGRSRVIAVHVTGL